MHCEKPSLRCPSLACPPLGSPDFSTLPGITDIQKNPRVRIIFCPQFWGRKSLRHFYGRLEQMPSLGRGGGIWLFFGGGGGGGGKCRFYFYGREDLSERYQKLQNTQLGVPKPGWQLVKSRIAIRWLFLTADEVSRHKT